MADLAEIEFLQRQPGGQRPVVVAGDTVAVEEKPVVVGGQLRLGGLEPGAAAEHSENESQGASTSYHH